MWCEPEKKPAKSPLSIPIPQHVGEASAAPRDLWIHFFLFIHRMDYISAKYARARYPSIRAKKTWVASFFRARSCAQCYFDRVRSILLGTFLSVPLVRLCDSESMFMFWVGFFFRLLFAIVGRIIVAQLHRRDTHTRKKKAHTHLDVDVNSFICDTYSMHTSVCVWLGLHFTLLDTNIIVKCTLCVCDLFAHKHVSNLNRPS